MTDEHDGRDDHHEHDGRDHRRDSGQDAFRALLHAQRVWDTELPVFDAAAAPDEPLPLFHRWFTEAVAAGQSEPHTMTLATADERGRPDVRILMLHDADARGWHFASHATSRKGRQLAGRPEAALGFYWAVQGRAVRLRGRVLTAGAEESGADLRARSTGALASALVGRQSEVLGSRDELARASRAAWRRAEREPTAEAESWTAYVLEPDEVEFFQGDADRRHVRLRYRREQGIWVRELLWP
ncbi:pyridoxal 5'-phosphate synthase [Streptomyces sp. AK02-01A]|uniref:pyridoxine/pyridoxamine 5'-phosphate oxidase n=1 Tax=Streptomyces sp. AK02-01A TaxID=3028648 RepID=UPI0029A49248|nr:pyridoxal 5'-phosphate synthase [Streptomyces sp. AK02-01A]MDX3851786.1 pyridoxal 5'-phosphate synthase [Streptomyces sp. AK02-01A]